MTDHDLERFVRAQDRDSTFDRALSELRTGRKRSHWMWFVFPQVAGLGHSSTAQAFALSDLDEARAYLAHAVLGPRLLECSHAALAISDASVEEVFGVVDAMKLRSSMTLFARAAPEEPVFAEVLDRYFDSRADRATDDLLG